MSARLYVAIGIMAILVVLWVAAYSWTTEETFEQQENDDKFLIYASFFPYYEFTKNIVGEKAEIVQFIPSGSQTHDSRIMIVSLLHVERDNFIFSCNSSSCILYAMVFFL